MRATKRFFSSTLFEREIMSTNKIIKRVALVAAAALAIGGVNAVSANALAVPQINGSSASVTATVVVGAYAAETFTAGSADNYYTITSTGVGKVNYPSVASTGTSTLSVSGNSEVWSNSAGAIGTGANFAGTESLAVSAYSAVAGSQIVTVKGNVSAAITLTITWGAAPAFSAAFSTAINNNVVHAATNAATVDDALTAPRTAIAGDIAVVVKDGSGTAFNGATVTASVTGAGLVAIGTSTSGATTGTARVATSGVLAGNLAFVYVSGDGTPGVGTITISVYDPTTSTTTTLATKSVTFTGAVATLTAVRNLSILKAGGVTYAGLNSSLDATTVATIPALTVFATDSTGNKSNAAASVKIISSDPTIISAGACTAATSSSAVVGEYNCVVNGTVTAASGKSATITAEASTDGGATFTILASPVTYTIGGAISVVTIATDAPTYLAGSALSIIATAKDASGFLAYDQDTALFSATTLTASTVLGGGVLPSNAVVELINGVHKFSGFYAPVVSGTGSLTITGKDSTTSANVVTATASITDAAGSSSTALLTGVTEATNAAKAATIAATAAGASADAATAAAKAAGVQAVAALNAVTALTVQVKAILTKIASLSVLIVRIIKKVKA
jgi:hypothetical protein